MSGIELTDEIHNLISKYRSAEKLELIHRHLKDEIIDDIEILVTTRFMNNSISSNSPDSPDNSLEDYSICSDGSDLKVLFTEYKRLMNKESLERMSRENAFLKLEHFLTAANIEIDTDSESEPEMEDSNPAGKYNRNQYLTQIQYLKEKIEKCRNEDLLHQSCKDPNLSSIVNKFGFIPEEEYDLDLESEESLLSLPEDFEDIVSIYTVPHTM